MRLPAVIFAAAAAFLAMASMPQTTTALGGPGVTPVPCPTQEWQLGDPKFDALPGAKAFFGRYDGGLYKIEIPDNWNGELSLFAHGYEDNQGAQGSTLRVRNAPIREHLIKEGFAWAASSYRCNGFVPGQGLLDTMALTDLFTKFNGGRAPQRVYLTGDSMGGHIALLGMQQFPDAFAGGLPMCASGPAILDFLTAVAAAAEVVTGVQFKKESVGEDLNAAAAALGIPPDYTAKGRQLASIEILLSGGPRPFVAEGLSVDSRFTADIMPAALVGDDALTSRVASNTNVTYAIDAELGVSADVLNARARRKAPDAALHAADGAYAELVPFNGRFARPVLTIHGTGDMVVPISLEQTLKRAVVSAGTQELLVQRMMRVARHCAFSPQERIRAFDDLVKWVRGGTKPDGDDVMGDLSNAGLKFTDPLRPNDPGGVRVTAGPKQQ